MRRLFFRVLLSATVLWTIAGCTEKTSYYIWTRLTKDEVFRFMCDSIWFVADGPLMGRDRGDAIIASYKNNDTSDSLAVCGFNIKRIKPSDTVPKIEEVILRVPPENLILETVIQLNPCDQFIVVHENGASDHTENTVATVESGIIRFDEIGGDMEFISGSFSLTTSFISKEGETVRLNLDDGVFFADVSRDGFR